MVTIDDFKPYGFMTSAYQGAASLGNTPSAWDKTIGYASWIDARAQDIGDQLWPLWTPAGWTGAARNTAIDLTIADLELMAGPLRNASTWPGREMEKGPTNDHWFAVEDQLFTQQWEGRFQVAFPGVDPQAMYLGFQRGDDLFAGSISFLLKERLNRPRPHQAAYWLGPTLIPSLPNLQGGRSAWSSAAISGHTFQGLMACLAAFLDQGSKMNGKAVILLQRYAADIADRRVFAGVHYPSDNVMSWWTAFEALPMLAPPGKYQAMKDFTVGVVKESLVYQNMVKLGSHATCVSILEQCFI